MGDQSPSLTATSATADWDSYSAILTPTTTRKPDLCYGIFGFTSELHLHNPRIQKNYGHRHQKDKTSWSRAIPFSMHSTKEDITVLLDTTIRSFQEAKEGSMYWLPLQEYPNTFTMMQIKDFQLAITVRVKWSGANLSDCWIHELDQAGVQGTLETMGVRGWQDTFEVAYEPVPVPLERALTSPWETPGRYYPSGRYDEVVICPNSGPRFRPLKASGFFEHRYDVKRRSSDFDNFQQRIWVTVGKTCENQERPERPSPSTFLEEFVFYYLAGGKLMRIRNQDDFETAGAIFRSGF